MPATVNPPRTIAAVSSTICVIRMILRRSAISAKAPATRPKSSVGAVLAVCTSATMNADGVSVAINQAAIVACMVYPSATPIEPK